MPLYLHVSIPDNEPSDSVLDVQNPSHLDMGDYPWRCHCRV